MFFFRTSAALLIAAVFATAQPLYRGSFYGGYSRDGALVGSNGADFGFGSGFGNGQTTGTVSGVSAQGFNNGYGSNGYDVRGYGNENGNNGNGFSGVSDNGFSGASNNGFYGFSGNGFSGASNNGFSGASNNGLTPISGNGFTGVSGRGFNGLGYFSNVPGVLFGFPALTATTTTRVPQQNNDLATLAILSAFLENNNNNNYNSYGYNYDDNNSNNYGYENENQATNVQTVTRQSYTDATARDSSNSQASNVAFVPIVTVPAPAQTAKTTKIVKTTIETNAPVTDIDGLNDGLSDLSLTSQYGSSFDAAGSASATNAGAYSAVSSSGVNTQIY